MPDNTDLAMNTAGSGRGFTQKSGRMSERDRLMKSRRRAKLDRVLRSMRGIHIVGAERQREEAMARIMLEYDSGDELSEQMIIEMQSRVLSYMHPTLSEQQRKQQQLQLSSGEGGGGGGRGGMPHTGGISGHDTARNGDGAWRSPSLQQQYLQQGSQGDRLISSGGQMAGNQHQHQHQHQNQNQNQNQQHQRYDSRDYAVGEGDGREIGIGVVGGEIGGVQSQEMSPSRHGRVDDPPHDQSFDRVEEVQNRSQGMATTVSGRGGGNRVGGQSIDTDVYKYKVPPVAPEEDRYLPHRSRVRVGEVVDEWHVLQEMHTRAGELGEKAYQESVRAKQRQYQAELRAQEEELRKREREREVAKLMDRELVDSAVSKGRAQEEVERRERQRKANQLHNMYREQEMAVEHRKEMEREQKEREEREMLSRMREETRRAEEEEEAKRRDARERAARQKEIVLEQLQEHDRVKMQQRLDDAEYARKYEERMDAEEERRRETERKRAERIGKLEIMSSDNAQREKAIKMEEDRRFLAGLSKEEARQERLARESKEREAREKSEYSAYLSEIMERKKVERRRERETQALVGEQELRQFREDTIREREESMRKKSNEQQMYREQLFQQMEQQQEKQQLRYRMSDKERAINQRTFNTFVESGRSGLPPGAPGGTPIMPDQHNFAYSETFRPTASAATHKSSPQNYSMATTRGGGVSGIGYQQQQQYQNSPTGGQQYQSPGGGGSYGGGNHQYQSPGNQHQRRTPGGERDSWPVQSRDSPMSRGGFGGTKISPMAGSAERNFFN